MSALKDALEISKDLLEILVLALTLKEITRRKK